MYTDYTEDVKYPVKKYNYITENYQLWNIIFINNLLIVENLK